MAATNLSISVHLDNNRIPEYIEGIRLGAQNALHELAQYTVQAVEPYTPIKTGKLSNPVIRSYGGNAYLSESAPNVYIQWTAKHNGYYYAPIQNAVLYDNYTTHGGPGFMDAANTIIQRLANDYLRRYLPQ